MRDPLTRSKETNPAGESDGTTAEARLLRLRHANAPHSAPRTDACLLGKLAIKQVRLVYLLGIIRADLYHNEPGVAI